MPTAFFIVRATVSDPRSARRSTNGTARSTCPTPRRHSGRRRHGASGARPTRRSSATYQLADRASLDRGTSAAKCMKRLVADFDKAWPGIPRQREIMRLVEELGG